MKKVFLTSIVILFFNVAHGACLIDNTGQITGAACTIKEANSEQSSVIRNKKQTMPKKEKFNPEKMNFKFNRGLLYRNVTILWFNE